MKYDYKCTSCKTESIIEHSMTEDARTLCTDCGKETLVRVIGVAPIAFKGEGWTSKEMRSNSMARG